MAFAPDGRHLRDPGARPRRAAGASSSTRTATSSRPGARRAPGRASSTSRIRSRSTPRASLYVADRNNQRIQVFDADGNYLRESKHPGTPCGLFISSDQHIWLAHGHAGQVIKLDLDGKVLGVTGKQGKALGQFGEAHFIAVSAEGRRLCRRHAELAGAEIREKVRPDRARRTESRSHAECTIFT